MCQLLKKIIVYAFDHCLKALVNKIESLYKEKGDDTFSYPSEINSLRL
jgi:hypothetical protein